MSTRCRIGIEGPNGFIRSVYSHWDGYPELPGVGAVLRQHYRDREKVEALIERGSISTVGEVVEPHPDGFDAREESTGILHHTRAYRDRGDDEKETAPQTSVNRRACLALAYQSWGEYAYLFTCDGWLMARVYKDQYEVGWRQIPAPREAS